MSAGRARGQLAVALALLAASTAGGAACGRSTPDPRRDAGDPALRADAGAPALDGGDLDGGGPTTGDAAAGEGGSLTADAVGPDATLIAGGGDGGVALAAGPTR